MKKIFIFLTFSIILSSCSIFSGSRKMDMSPFAENTRAFFGEAIKIERPFQWKHLQPYTGISEIQEAFKLAPPILDALRGIVYYSNQVVAINNSKLSDRDKNNMLASYLNEIMEKALAKERSDTLQFDVKRARNVLDNIRNAKTYLDGIAAAEPIIHSVVAEVLERIDKFQNQIPRIIAGFSREIEKDFASPRENYLRLHKLQEKIMLSVSRLYRAYRGETEELEILLQEYPYLSKLIPSADKATHDNLLKIEKFLVDQLTEIDTIIHQMDEIKAEYQAKHDEVVAWRTQLDDKILIARASLTIWARAHKNLGAGVPVAPLIDVAGIASNLAGTAAKTVVP